MKKVIITALLMLFLSSVTFLSKLEASPAPNLGRTWLYFNSNIAFSPEWSLTIMPGHRFEFYRSGDNDALHSFYYEFFMGPNYTKRFSDFTLRFSLWYSYMGFDLNRGALNSYLYSHNLAFIPSIDYRIGKLTLNNRMMFYSKFYANNDLFTTSDQRWGFSLLLREMVRVSYSITDQLSVLIADEIFVGLKEDSGTHNIRKGEPFFEEQGIPKNRLHLGCVYKINPSLSISPQYIWETNFDTANNHKLKDKTHYIFLSIDYLFKLYD